MKKSLSLLLAIALVFSAFSSLAFAAETQQSAGQILAKAGILKGSGDGNLKEDDVWTRQDVTVLLSRLYGEEDAAKATAKNHTFADVKGDFYDGYITWAKEEGYMQGHSAVRFGFDEVITPQQFATVVLRVLGLDVDYDTALESAIELGLLPEGTSNDDEFTRGDSFVAIVALLNTEVEEGVTLGASLGLVGFVPEAGDQAIASFKAVGAKKLEVKLVEAVDPAKVSVSLARGNFPANLKEVKWSDDKKTATIESITTLQKADYTVTLTGAAPVDLTATVSVEAEKVAAINVNNTKAPLVDANNNKVFVFFNIVNQYGEDVTAAKLSGVTYGISKGTAGAYADGKLTVELASGTYSIGEKLIFSATYIGGGESAFVSETLEVSPAARVASIDFTSLYGKDKKELKSDSTIGEFAVLVDAKDQYGNAVTPAQLNADVSVQVAGNAVALPSAPVFTADAAGSGKVGIVLQGTGSPAKFVAGKATLFAVSTASGDSSSFEVTVAEAPALHKLTLYTPEFAVAGEKIEIPFEAIDQFGNPITSEASLTAGLNGGALSATQVNGVTPTLTFVQDHVNNKIKLELNTTGVTVTDNAMPLIITGQTAKVHQEGFISLNISLQPNAKPVVITSVEGITKAIAEGGSTVVKPSNVKIVDQYGRIKDAAFFSGSTVNISSDAPAKVSASAGTVASDVTLSGVAEGSANITLNVNGVANSDLTVNIKVVKKDSIVSYEANDVATLYAGGSSYARDLKVQGVLADGSKVAVPNNGQYYNVTGSVYGLVLDTSNADKVTVYANPTIDVAANADATFVIVVQGQVAGNKVDNVIKEVVVSKKAPVATTFDVKNGTVLTSAKKEADAYVSISAAELAGKTAAQVAADVVKVVDQYGFEMSGQIANAVASVSNISDVTAGNDFIIQIVSNNAKVFDFKVRVK